MYQHGLAITIYLLLITYRIVFACSNDNLDADLHRYYLQLCETVVRDAFKYSSTRRVSAVDFISNQSGHCRLTLRLQMH